QLLGGGAVRHIGPAQLGGGRLHQVVVAAARGGVGDDEHARSPDLVDTGRVRDPGPPRRAYAGPPSRPRGGTVRRPRTPVIRGASGTPASRPPAVPWPSSACRTFPERPRRP